MASVGVNVVGRHFETSWHKIIWAEKKGKNVTIRAHFSVFRSAKE